ncbi:alanine aminotransferase [Schizosaccharomyces cryophilus OY26]|uniref:Glutamate pyruvate transaminase n=1 Tax=Schizosaccharomyces cryophilus (strain OY26 / ATCC MYA-4695 / CBS 11777 / NBRC 106824 / NRRL Y48691) TaxID=653667 RepID=S9XBE0_SCHCR|nr:alanine aminotransferase [Schizosaccharomyces cryophilus OY26]EPY51091.1 alanine aminotransferase [Schizosaccharomyces cryophilus OY26]
MVWVVEMVCPFQSIHEMMNSNNYRPNAFAHISTLNQQVIKANYAVRGPLTVLAEKIQNDLLEDSNDYPFGDIIYANIGNPQQFGQLPITFNRQVLSICQYPALLDHANEPWFKSIFPRDVVERTELLLKETGSVGAYSASQGIPIVRKHVAEFIQERDNCACHPDDIYLTSGATQGARIIMTLLISGPSEGAMLPIPQYPLYGALMDLFHGKSVSYYLSEKDDWNVDVKQFKQAYEEESKKGTNIRLCVFINPGNPTGACMTEESIEEMLRFAKAKGLVIISDEVYQNNIFRKEFTSFRKVLCELERREPNSNWDKVSLICINSVSKGQFGECGQRGGYIDTMNIPPITKDQILKLATIDICPPVTGQLLVDLLVRPPREGEPSYGLYSQEIEKIHRDMEKQCQFLYEATKRMKFVTCQKPHGAMYLHPKICLPKKLVREANEINIEPDELYCLRILERTGVCLVPGSGLGQRENEYHVRITFLAKGDEYVERFIEAHNTIMDEYED